MHWPHDDEAVAVDVGEAIAEDAGGKAQPPAKAWNFSKGKIKRRARTFQTGKKQPSDCQPRAESHANINPANEETLGLRSPVEGEDIAPPIFIPTQSRAGGSEKWMMEREIKGLYSKLAKAESKHEDEKVKA